MNWFFMKLFRDHHAKELMSMIANESPRRRQILGAPMTINQKNRGQRKFIECDQCLMIESRAMPQPPEEVLLSTTRKSNWNMRWKGRTLKEEK